MSKIKILIVDDYSENITALSQLIRSDDVEVFAASNADQALEMVSRYQFGLALLDVQMPGTSGFELAKIIRGVKKYKSLPIIFVTAHQEDSAFLFESYETGAVDCLFKPLQPSMVRAKVQMFVELAQQRELLQEHVSELERLRIEAESANMAKSQFLANMSHEIRTPLAAVMGFSELMARATLTDEERTTFNAAIQRNGNLLLKLVDDILDLSKIEANRLEMETIEFDLNELIRDLSAILSLRAEEKGIRFVLPETGLEPRRYASDPLRIKQVLLNIIGNAIKFTNQGSVRVELDIETASISDRDRLRFLVRDEGVGLSEEQSARLFRPFGQADSSTRRSFGGSGLGLVISRQLARALGGEVRLRESKPGVGSTFEVLFELKRGASVVTREEDTTIKQRAEIQGACLNGLKVLAVDDSPDNLTLIEMYLRGSGAELAMVESGPEAVAQIRDATFDVVLMDVQMPEMDGHQTTQEIRRLGYEKPVIALTAHAIRDEFERCKRSGCDDVLTKPITRASLIQALAEYV